MVNAIETAGFTNFCASFIGDDLGLCLFLSHRSSARAAQMSELSDIYKKVMKVAITTAKSINVSILDDHIKF